VCKLNTIGIEKLAFFEHISLYFENGTRYGHSYNERQRIKLVYAIYRILPFSM